jgi:hypothetical protein
MSSDDELRDILSETAQELARIQSNPRTWLSWMVYLLARLEGKAANQSPAGKESYVSMLAALQDEIRNRLKTGGWH